MFAKAHGVVEGFKTSVSLAAREITTAAYNGEEVRLSSLLYAKSDCNSRGPFRDPVLQSVYGSAASRSFHSDGATALILAAEAGQTGTVSLLCKARGIQINQTDKETGKTALGWAVERGHADVVTLLLRDPGIDAERPNTQGDTPLMIASQNGHDNIVTLLTKVGRVKVDTVNRSGENALMIAARHGQAGVVQVLLTVPGIQLNERGLYSSDIRHAEFSALMWAVVNGHNRVVELLVAQRIPYMDVNAACPRGSTSLHLAVEEGNASAVQLLLNHPNIDREVKDEDGETALDIAHGLASSGSGYDNIVALLDNEAEQRTMRHSAPARMLAPRSRQLPGLLEQRLDREVATDRARAVGKPSPSATGWCSAFSGPRGGAGRPQTASRANRTNTENSKPVNRPGTGSRANRTSTENTKSVSRPGTASRPNRTSSENSKSVNRPGTASRANRTSPVG